MSQRKSEFFASKSHSEWQEKIKISSRQFFCPPFNLPEKIILAIIL